MAQSGRPKADVPKIATKRGVTGELFVSGGTANRTGCLCG